MITTYKVEEIDDWEDFVNKLFNGLKHYETKNKDFKFKITCTDKTIEVKTLKLGHHAN